MRRRIGRLLGGGVLAVAAAAGAGQTTQSSPAAVAITSRSIPLLRIGGLQFRDLDRDGRLTPYEDWRLPPAARADDLLGRLTLAEKAGAVMHGSLPGTEKGLGAVSSRYDMPAVRDLIAGKNVTSFITRLTTSPSGMAEQNNAVQAIAEQGRLGIPVLVSSDPRHHFQAVFGAGVATAGFSQWPEPLGFAALRDPAMMRRFAEIARGEYRATGIHQTLSPQADLFTEPRWPRGTATFGADPALTRAMVRAYVAGFQAGEAGLGRRSVLATVKHWVGYGATPHGWDGHNRYGRFVRLDATTLPLHIEPFKGAFAAHVGAVMPTYSIVDAPGMPGPAIEPVGAGFSSVLIDGMLRGAYGFSGIVLSDWAITNDCLQPCRVPTARRPQQRGDIAMPWGVEGLTRLQRFALGMNAGLDQFGGVAEPELIVEALERRLITPARLDAAVRRILVAKFELGLFDAPFVDEAAADKIVNAPAIRAESERAQAGAQVMLSNRGGLLPLRPGTRVFLHGIDPGVARARGLVPVDSMAAAQVAVMRATTPFQRLHPHHAFGGRQNEGRLDFRRDNPDLVRASELAARLPLVVSLFLDRPAVLGRMNDLASATVANFGVSDAALLDGLTGRVPIAGRLPFELPSSDRAVRRQDPAKPDDSRSPLYPFGAGIVRR